MVLVAYPIPGPYGVLFGGISSALRPGGSVLALEVDTVHLTSRGQGLAEYALILALIAILAITALLFLSGQINTILSSIGDAL